MDTNQSNNGESLFDTELDFKYYYYDFLKLGIDLLEEDIEWNKFNYILDGLLLTENTAIGKVVGFRSYKAPTKIDKYNREEVEYNRKMKNLYSLRKESKVENGLEKMFNYIEKKAGVTSE